MTDQIRRTATMPPASRLVAEPERGARRGRRWLVVALTVLAVLGVALAVGVKVAAGLVRERAVALAGRYGLELVVGGVDVPLWSGIALTDVEVWSAASGSRLQVARLDRVTTDVSLGAAVFGKRRPGHLELRGGFATVRWDNGLIDLAARPAAVAGDGAESAALSVAVAELELRVEARHDTPLGPATLAPLRVRGLELELLRASDRKVRAGVKGRLDSAGRDFGLSAAWDEAAGTASLELGEGAELLVETSRGELALTARGLYLDDDLIATDVGLALGDDRVGMARVKVALAGIRPAEVRGRRLDDLGGTISLEGLRAERGPLGAPARANAEAVEIVIAPGSPPRPVSLLVRGGALEVRDAIRELGLSAQAERLDVGFATDVALADALDRPLDLVTRLSVSRPRVDVTLPNRPEEAPSEPAEPPDPASGELPVLANDEALPPVEAVVPAMAPGSDWLGVLLGATDGASGDLLDLVPESLRAELPNLVRRVSALSPRIEDASVTVRGAGAEPLLTLEGAAFGASRSELGHALSARAAIFRPGRDGAKVEAARVDLQVTLADDLAIEMVEARASGRSLANQVSRFVRHLSVQEDAEVDLAVTYHRPKDPAAPHHVEGRVALANFSFEFWRIADREITDLQASATFDASIDRQNHRLLLTLPRIEVGESHFSASLDLTRKKKKLPRFSAKLTMPRQDCGAAARSIPKALIPTLSTLKLAGEMEFAMTLDLDLANPRDLSLRVTGDTTGCQALSLGPGVDPAALRGPYVHRPQEPKRGVLEHIRVGPGTPEWVPMERIPKLVLAAAWITEDRRYREHGGVRWDLVQTALKMDLDHGRFIYGGSTITQQLVKNLYLTRDKHLARKFEEMIIAWAMERVLTKDEILTLYVNCIEYGPDLYGIRQAARAYFDKRVEQLDALEAAFIMGLKPYPKAGYNQFLKGTLDVWWVRRVSYVLRLMAKYEPTLISLEEAEAFAPFQPAFREPPIASPRPAPRAPRNP